MKTNGKTYSVGLLKLLVLFFLTAVILWKAIYWRISHTYLEDDLSWFSPIINHLLNKNISLLVLLKSFHLPELTLFDAAYFIFLKQIFGYNFNLYPIPSCLIHLVNGVVIYQILSRALNCSSFTSIIAGLIYLTFYGHYHAYLWPMSMHHALGVFVILSFLYMYLMTQEKGTPNFKQNLALYIYAFLASFMRMSILLIPFIIGTHLFLTSARAGFFLKIKRWIPVFLFISWYQIFIFIVGNHADVLSSFLSIKYLIALGIGAFLLLWCMAKRNSQQIYYFWLIIPFVFILCLYLWLFPQWTLTPSTIALRWQIMPFPAGITMWAFLIILSGVVMFAFTRHVLYRNNKFGVFIIWYIAVFPYLLFRINEMPSRYLIYLSPVFAVVIAVFLGEIVSNRIKGFYKNTFKLATGCLILFVSLNNILAIHERSMRSFLADYHWKYDDIVVAQYIKHDLMTNKTLQDRNILCIQNVNSMSFLEGWSQRFLKDQGIDGNESLKITLASLGIDKERSRINEPCGPADTIYNFQNDTLLSHFRWPINILKEDAWAIYGETFNGDSDTIRIDNILQRQVNHFYQDKAYWRLEQGDLVENYRGFGIYNFKNWYFVIPEGEPFNLARFKVGDYQQSYFANTKFRVRQWIDFRTHVISHVESIVFREGANGKRYIPQAEHIFNLKFLGIKWGYLHIKNEGILIQHGQEFYRISIDLKPWVWLQKISKGHWEIKMRSLLDRNSLLPVEYEQIDLNKRPSIRKIIYHHDGLFMERRGYKEDINFDTRDPAGLILWVLTNDYTHQLNYSTTFNIEKNLYNLNIISTPLGNDKTMLKLNFKSMCNKPITYNLITVFDNERTKDLIPKSVVLRMGIISIYLYR